MHHFFIQPEQVEGDEVLLSPEQAHQLARVLRLEAGARICVLDGSGEECTAVLQEVAPARATARIVERQGCSREPRVSLSLGLALLKGERMEWAVQKATEVGVCEILPVACARSVVRLDEAGGAAKSQRWQKIAREAAEQCRRGRVPEVARPARLSSLLAHLAEFDCVLIADEVDTTPLAVALAPEAHRVLLLIGPEGGFAPDEVAAARAAGARPVSLGARILRAETAAVVGCALVLHEMETHAST